MMPWRWERRAVAALTGWVLVAAGGSTAAHAAALFATAEASTVVVRGTVERVTPYEAAKLQVFRIRVARVLKGDVAAGETLDLAQEMLFAATKPYFTPGTETLVFAVPLPPYSAFREALPEGRYWRWTERLETAADVAPLADPALTEAVAGHLATRDDPEASAAFMVRALVGASARVRQDALAAIAGRAELPPLLDAARLAPLGPWLGDAAVPVGERAAVLGQLARAGAPGVVPLAEGIAGTEGPLRPAAVDALVAIEAPPPLERLLAWSRSSDDALRLAAGRGLARNGSPAALDRIAELLEGEHTPAVRRAVVQALGRTRNPRAVELLARELERPDKDVVLAAADALARQDGEAAIAALAKALESGGENAQTAAAFALKRMNRDETDEILERVEQTHPDPRVRRLCKLALGESMHEH